MTREQIETSLDWYAPMGAVRVFLRDGSVVVGNLTDRDNSGITIDCRRYSWAEVESAESGMFA